MFQALNLKPGIHARLVDTCPMLAQDQSMPISSSFSFYWGRSEFSMESLPIFVTSYWLLWHSFSYWVGLKSQLLEDLWHPQNADQPEPQPFNTSTDLLLPWKGILKIFSDFPALFFCQLHKISTFYLLYKPLQSLRMGDSYCKKMWDIHHFHTLLISWSTFSSMMTISLFQLTFSTVLIFCSTSQTYNKFSFVLRHLGVTLSQETWI